MLQNIHKMIWGYLLQESSGPKKKIVASTLTASYGHVKCSSLFQGHGLMQNEGKLNPNSYHQETESPRKPHACPDPSRIFIVGVTW